LDTTNDTCKKKATNTNDCKLGYKTVRIGRLHIGSYTIFESGLHDPPEHVEEVEVVF
jgi:hypothetical protein